MPVFERRSWHQFAATVDWVIGRVQGRGMDFLFIQRVGQYV